MHCIATTVVATVVTKAAETKQFHTTSSPMPQSPACQDEMISELSCGHAHWACRDMSLGSMAKSQDPASSPSVAILPMAIILVLHGVVFPVTHTPLSSIKSGMILDSLYRMCAPVLQTGPSGGQSLRPQGYAFLTD